jgi:hypothetical protein
VWLIFCIDRIIFLASYFTGSLTSHLSFPICTYIIYTAHFMSSPQVASCSVSAVSGEQAVRHIESYAMRSVSHYILADITFLSCIERFSHPHKRNVLSHSQYYHYFINTIRLRLSYQLHEFTDKVHFQTLQSSQFNGNF